MHLAQLALLLQAGAVLAHPQPLSKRSPPRQIHTGIPLNAKTVKYTRSDSLQERDNIVQGQGQHWYASVTFGQQAQPFTMLIDTGSPDLLLFNTNVDTSDSDLSYQNKACAESYGGGDSGSTSGDIYNGPYQVADIGGTSGLFCLAPPLKANTQAQDGIVGLSLLPQGGGRSVASQTGNTVTTASGWSGFGLYLSSGSQGGSGQLTPNGADSNYYQSEDLWTYEDVIQDTSVTGQPGYPGYWQFSYTSYSINGQSTTPPRPFAFIDSGNPFINLDSAAAQAVWSAVEPGLTASGPKQPPAVDCSYIGNAPSLFLTAGSGAVYEIPSSVYIKQAAGGACFVAVVRVDDDSRLNVFGVPFVQTYYTYFDVDNLQLDFNPSDG